MPLLTCRYFLYRSQTLGRRQTTKAMAGSPGPCFVNEVLPPAVGEQNINWIWLFSKTKPTSNYFNIITFCFCGWCWCFLACLGWLEKDRIKDFKRIITGNKCFPLWSQCEGTQLSLPALGSLAFFSVCLVCSWQGNNSLLSVLLSLEGSVRKQWHKRQQPLRKHNSPKLTGNVLA